MIFKAVAITTCVNYDDYLSLTLPLNRNCFSEFKIITDLSNSSKLRNLAQNYSCDLVITDCFYENASFNKGKAINYALKKIDNNSWVCHLDADIILPSNFVNLINDQNLDKKTIYGCTRYLCPKKTVQIKKALKGEIDLRWKKGSTPGGYHIGNSKTWLPKHPRVWMPQVPIGFFQLFHTSKGFTYPNNMKDAGGSDIFFACQWKSHKHLPINVVHLPVIKGQSKENWSGRTTASILDFLNSS